MYDTKIQVICNIIHQYIITNTLTLYIAADKHFIAIFIRGQFKKKINELGCNQVFSR